MRKSCTDGDCSAAYYAQGRCKRHYQKAARTGVITVTPGKGAPGRPRAGERQYFGPGRQIMSNGYARIRLSQGVWVLEHRHVMEQKLGRPLYPDENVHHIDGDRLNNTLDNLELWVTRQPRGQRVEDVLAWAREIIARYG